jgi:sulfur-carrier protein
VVEAKTLPVRVKVLYFGQAKDEAGTGVELLTLPDAPSVKTAMSESVKAHRSLRRLTGGMRVAVNEEIADEDRRLQDGDVVAFLPPVAGG